MGSRWRSGRIASVCAVFVALMLSMANATDLGALRKIQDTIAGIQLSESPNTRADKGEYLAQLTTEINPEDIDDETLAALISLLDNSDESVRGWVAKSLETLGRAPESQFPPS